jgi:hypothetical protein
VILDEARMHQTHIKAYKTMIKVEIKLLQLVLRLEDREAEECFKRWNNLRKRWIWHHKSIHLPLEVKTFFGNSTSVMGPNTESNTPKPVLPTDSHHRHHRKREKEEYAHEKLQSKAWVTTLSKINQSWPNDQTSRHAKASSGTGFISLHQLALNTSKHVISQV